MIFEMSDAVNHLDIEDLKQKIIRAIVNLYRYDRELLTLNASERSITHKLAEHLQGEFPSWNVDCEYNRLGHDPKRLSVNFGVIEPCDTEAKTVFPDIIIHRRNTAENALIIEFKKAHIRSATNDKAKLRAFTDPKGDYRYQIGLFLVVGERGCTEAMIYKGGEKTNENWKEIIRSTLAEIEYAQ